MALTAEQQAAIDAANARIEARRKEAERNAAVPTERIRTAAQGLTLGFADEAEARAVSLATGRPYEEVLAEIRGRVEAYRQARPLEALGYEAGGAAAPALAAALAAPFTGGSSTALVAPTLGRLALRGAAEGAAYGFGTGEGGVTERLSRIPGGAAGGAVGGVVAGGLARAAGGAFTALTDAARRVIGRRGASIVENEIQRLAAQTGKTADEIAADVAAGRLLGENQTIRAAVRAYRAGGGPASTTIEAGIKDRPAETSAAMMEELRQYLSGAAEPAVVAQRQSDEAARAAERAAYSRFEGVEASPEVANQVLAALEVVPEAIGEVNKMFRGLVSETPAASGVGPANITFTRPITVDEAERVRRAIANAASAEYRAGYGGAGEVFKEAEIGLRSLLDASVPELASARAQAAAVRTQREAFEAGRAALGGDANVKIDDFSRMTNPEAIQAYRAGFMAALEARAMTGSRQSLIRNLVDPSKKEGALLRAVFPQDQLDDVLMTIETARGAQQAQQYIMGGSPTSETMLETGRRGMGISPSDITGILSGDPNALIRVASNVVSRFGRDLSDAEKNRVAQILVSQDANLVRRAIQDDSALAALQQRISEITAGITRGAGRSGAILSGEQAAPVSEQMLRGLLAQ